MLKHNQMQYPPTMKTPSLKTPFGDEESSTDDQMTETVVEALAANDKVIEIRPADQSKGLGIKKFLLLGVGALGLAYWVRNSETPDEFIENVKEKASTQVDHAEEAIEEGSETASERIEEGSGRVSEAVETAGETAADRTEEAGEKATPETDGGSAET